jgi:hypothetical protein
MKFIKRPIALPSNYRFFYQLSILLLILELCCAKNVGASILKFQLLAWVLRDDEGCNSLMKITKLKDTKHNFNFWALDPALNRAIEFSLADGFLILKNEKIISSPKGDALLSYILETDVFIHEKETLKKFGKSVTEYFVNTVLKNENA